MSLIENYFNEELSAKLSSLYEELIVKQGLDSFVLPDNSENSQSEFYYALLDPINTETNEELHANTASNLVVYNDELVAVSNFLYYIKTIHDGNPSPNVDVFLSRYFDGRSDENHLTSSLPSFCTLVNVSTDFKFAASDAMNKLKQFTSAASAVFNTIETHNKNMIIRKNKDYIAAFHKEISDGNKIEMEILDAAESHYKEIGSTLVKETDSLKSSYKNYSDLLDTVSKNYDERKASLINATQELEHNSAELSDAYKSLTLTELSLDFDSRELIEALLDKKTTNRYDEELNNLTTDSEKRIKHLEELKTQMSEISISRDEIEILKNKRKGDLLSLMKVDLENKSKDSSNISDLYNSILTSDHLERIDGIEYNLIPLNELKNFGITSEASVPVNTVIKNIDNEIKSLYKSISKKTDSLATLSNKSAKKDLLRSEIQKETFNLASNEEQIKTVSSLKKEEDEVITKNNNRANELLQEFTDKYSDIYKNDLKYIIGSFNRISEIYTSVGLESDLSVNTDSPECKINDFTDVIKFTDALKKDIHEKYSQLSELNALVKDEKNELFKETVSELNAADEAALKEARESYIQAEERYNKIKPIAAKVSELYDHQTKAQVILENHWYANRMTVYKHSETTTSFIQDIVANTNLVRKNNHNDSAQYTNMIAAATAVLNINDNCLSTDFESYKEKITALKEQTEKYINEKNKQFRPFPSSQRKYRLAFANDLLSICNDYIESFNELETYTDIEKTFDTNKINHPVLYSHTLIDSDEHQYFAISPFESDIIHKAYQKSIKETGEILNSNDIRTKDKFDFYDLSTENGKSEQVTAKTEHSEVSKEKEAISKTN